MVFKPWELESPFPSSFARSWPGTGIGRRWRWGELPGIFRYGWVGFWRRLIGAKFGRFSFHVGEVLVVYDISCRNVLWNWRIWSFNALLAHLCCELFGFIMSCSFTWCVLTCHERPFWALTVPKPSNEKRGQHQGVLWIDLLCCHVLAQFFATFLLVWPLCIGSDPVALHVQQVGWCIFPVPSLRRSHQESSFGERGSGKSRSDRQKAKAVEGELCFVEHGGGRSADPRRQSAYGGNPSKRCANARKHENWQGKTWLECPKDVGEEHFQPCQKQWWRPWICGLSEAFPATDGDPGSVERYHFQRDVLDHLGPRWFHEGHWHRSTYPVKNVSGIIQRNVMCLDMLSLIHFSLKVMLSFSSIVTSFIDMTPRLGFNNCLKIADVPFPLPFAQLLGLLLMAFSLLIPVQLGGKSSGLVVSLWDS